ncbi:MAG: hypothetical protein GTO03_17240 [Planctomycetales bacterium]|nr:hypothetical protein [Planctomycetales bacterium]
MTRDEVVAQIQAALGDRLRDLRQPSEKRVFFEVAPEWIPETARLLYDTLQARLQTAAGVDAPQQIEILYHWAFDPLGLIVTVRTRVDRQQPQIASITPICPAAEWIEREMWELLGISFEGHPDLRHLLLQDDWPSGKYPLRRDYRRE